jgi:3-keto-disaccharide hydrolase
MILLVLNCSIALLHSQAKQGDSGWRPLFNGRDLDGWQQVGPGSFEIVDHTLKTQGGMGMLWYTPEKFANSVIRVIFKLTGKEADSGVFIRIPDKPRDVWMAINKGYEIEIGDWPSDYSCAGVVYSFSKAMARPIRRLGEWNAMEITIAGPRTVAFLNGVKVTDYSEGQPVPPRKSEGGEPAAGPRQDSGYIGLQNHPGSPVYFREISARTLK